MFDALTRVLSGIVDVFSSSAVRFAMYLRALDAGSSLIALNVPESPNFSSRHRKPAKLLPPRNVEQREK
jgi:hypothetical protein